MKLEIVDDPDATFVRSSHIKLTIESKRIPYTLNLIDVPGIIQSDPEKNDESAREQLLELIDNLTDGKEAIQYLCTHEATLNIDNCVGLKLLKNGAGDATTALDPKM
jgi:hypothetical protein